MGRRVHSGVKLRGKLLVRDEQAEFGWLGALVERQQIVIGEEGIGSWAKRVEQENSGRLLNLFEQGRCDFKPASMQQLTALRQREGNILGRQSWLRAGCVLQHCAVLGSVGMRLRALVI